MKRNGQMVKAIYFSNMKYDYAIILRRLLFQRLVITNYFLVRPSRSIIFICDKPLLYSLVLATKEHFITNLKIDFMRLSALYLFIIGSALTLSSCKKENTNTNYTTTKGREVEVGEGRAQTFITNSNAGVPQEIGVIFSDEALSGLPDVNTLYSLQFPQKAIEATPYKTVLLGLSAHGHSLPPSGSIAAHFDVRFMMMTEKESLALPAPTNTAPGAPAGGGYDVTLPGHVPANYVWNAALPQVAGTGMKVLPTPI